MVLTVLGAAATSAVGLGAAYAGVGIVFAAVAALTAQIGAFARTASGLAVAVLGAAFVLRAWGDSASSGAISWTVWLSPLGWAEQTRAFTGDRWWVLILPLATAVGLLVVAFHYSASRDLGHGLLAARPGPPRAAPGLRGGFGLAMRLDRTALLGWTLGFALAGALFGSVVSSAASALSDRGAATDLFTHGEPGDLGVAFVTSIVSLFAMIVGFFAVQSVLRARSEETEGRAETLLATALGRARWLGSHLAVALAGPVVILSGGAVGMAASVTATAVPGVSFGDVLVAGLVQVPAVWVVGAFAGALVGIWPRASRAGLGRGRRSVW